MRIAYLVLTHAMPDHLGRLITALRDSDTRFFVHVDRKVAIEPFLQHRGPDVEFLDRRMPVYWGEWQMVEATLRLMSRAIERCDPDYFVLLSGACYPIRSNRHIRNLLADGDTEFINSARMPNPRAHKPLSRLERFRFRSDQSWIRNTISAAPILMRGSPDSRRFSRSRLVKRDWTRELSLDPYAGSSWWALTGAAGRYVLDVAARERAIVRFFEHTRSPDETFFQTILANSSFAPWIRRNLTYADWTSAGSHPRLITEAHVEMFAKPGPLIEGGPYGSGELCFARKFGDDGGATTRLVDAVIRDHDPDERDR